MKLKKMSITPLYNLSLHFIEQGNSGVSPLEPIRAFHSRHLQSGTSTDASDISKVFEVDDILAVRVDISEDIRMKTPLVSP